MKLFYDKSKRFTGYNEASGALQGQSYEGSVNIDGSTKKKSRRFSLHDGSLPIKDDNSIIDRDKNKSNKPMQIQRVDLDLGWGNSPFYLSIEPWITSPVVSDTQDGIYVGNLREDRLECKDKVILLAIKVSTTFPMPVVALIKNKKIYVFKQTQLTDHAVKTFSKKIETADEFRSYAHNLMKNAHGDNYSEDKTNETVDGLLKEDFKDYGELVGKLQNSLGQKSFADAGPAPQLSDNPNIQAQAQGQPQMPPQGAVDDQGQSTGQDPNQPIEPQLQYSFEFQLGSGIPSLETLIGTLAYTPSICHLFHICTTDRGTHEALEEFYKGFPNYVDELAEVYIQEVPTANFTNIIAPEGKEPSVYLTEVRELCKAVKDKVKDDNYSPIIDNIITYLSRTLYKLKRLTEGKKTFSIRTFSTQEEREELADSLAVVMGDHFDRTGESLIPHKEFRDKREIQTYARNRSKNPITFKQFLKIVLTSGYDTFERGIKDVAKYHVDQSKKEQKEKEKETKRAEGASKNSFKSPTFTSSKDVKYTYNKKEEPKPSTASSQPKRSVVVPTPEQVESAVKSQKSQIDKFNERYSKRSTVNHNKIRREKPIVTEADLTDDEIDALSKLQDWARDSQVTSKKNRNRH